MDLIERSMAAVRFYCRYLTILRMTHPHLADGGMFVARYVIRPFEKKLECVLEGPRAQLQVATLKNQLQRITEEPYPSADMLAYCTGIFVWLIESVDHHLLGLQCGADIENREISNLDVFRYVGAWISVVADIPNHPSAPSIVDVNMQMLKTIAERYEDNTTEFGFGADNPVWDKVKLALAM